LLPELNIFDIELWLKVGAVISAGGLVGILLGERVPLSQQDPSQIWFILTDGIWKVLKYF